GERCMAISTSVLVGGVADAVLERVADRARRVVVGSGRDAASEMGPVITAASKNRIESIVSASVDEGASLVVDGRHLTVPGYEGGFFVGPTVVDDVRLDMGVYQQEIFGPVLTNVRVSSVEDAIALVNANPYGNGTAIFTSSGEAARRFHREVNVGMIGINVPIPVPMAYYSFGGWKDSLFGDHHVYGPEGVRFYTRAKAVTQRWPERRDESGASFAFPTGR
ncbi:MAG: aldehyde dehydrogenase family protein, partial [Acidobacteria bacterium]|nr:aldehyde dehydrogenase family protein [Acidobacteriota bacterium]